MGGDIMKYFKILSIQDDMSWDEFDAIWSKQLSDWYEEFGRIKYKLPKRFVKEFEKRAFHDYNMFNFSFSPSVNSRYKKDFSMFIKHPVEKSETHIVKLNGVEKLLLDGEFTYGFAQDWLYCEILTIKKNKFSIEIQFSNATLYAEFSKMSYKKILEKS
jgi:hypothetical protein